MNRRQVLSALLALPAVKSIAVDNLRPNDVIVIESDDLLSLDTMEKIKQQAVVVWPGRKVFVLDKGLRMRVIREGGRS